MPSYKFGIRDPREFVAGLFFLICGLAIFAMARAYPAGTLLSMGPGFYPTALSLILMLVGAVVLGRSLLISGPPFPPLALGVLALVVIPIAAFGYVVERTGLVATTLALVTLARLAGSDRRPLEIVILGVALAAFMTLVFVYGLHLPFAIWPRWS